MIVEINYLTVVLVGAVLSALSGVLWVIGRTFLQQYGSMLAAQLAAHRAADTAVIDAINKRVATIESGTETYMAALAVRLDTHDDDIAALRGVSSNALTHRDLEDLYTKVNATSGDVREMKGVLGAINENLRMILTRVADKAIP